MPLSATYAVIGSVAPAGHDAGSAYHSRWSAATFRTAAECRLSEFVQCSWKLDSSTASTS